MHINEQPNYLIFKVPLLISGILNAISAAITLLMCILVVITGAIINPLFFLGLLMLPFGIISATLAWAEFKAYQRFNAEDFDPVSIKCHLKFVGIIEVAMILLGNIHSLICGIIILSCLNQLDQDPRTCSR